MDSAEEEEHAVRTSWLIGRNQIWRFHMKISHTYTYIHKTLQPDDPQSSLINNHTFSSRTIGPCLILTAAMFFAPSVFAATQSCDVRVNNTHQKLDECITKEGLFQHLKAFQIIADNNADLPGSRVTGTAGYEGSVAYIVQKMTEAGYNVSLQELPLFISYTSVNELDMVSPTSAIYGYLTDFSPMSNTDGGNVTAELALPPGDKRGCQASDFVGFPVGKIALVKRVGTSTSPGECPMRVKVLNAAGAGAIGVITYREDISPTTLTQYTLGTPPLTNGVPAVAVRNGVANQFLALIQAGTPPRVHLNLQVVRKDVVTHNVIAESKTGNPNNVIMAGAHLDSVPAGPGINDNGSGSAAILEIALKMAKVKPVNKLRFAWWTAEEVGLVGSTFYVNSLSAAEKAKIAIYFNHDMMASDNGPRIITGTGSENIIGLYTGYFDKLGLAYYAATVYDAGAARSDHAPFVNAGIPTANLFTGAEGLWTAADSVAIPDLAPYRTIGQAYAGCYHLPCDNLDSSNLDMNLLEQMTRATAFAILSYGMNTKSLNGVKG